MKLSWSSIVQGPPSLDWTQPTTPAASPSSTQRAPTQIPSNISKVRTLHVTSQGPSSRVLTQTASPLLNVNNIQSANMQQVPSFNLAEETLPSQDFKRFFPIKKWNHLWMRVLEK
ncbi:uncharacterized protein LOC130808887 [Amaranthus tricolor]|uniref:uncharacterized protein LOC130808887 n=1 Tax=Amaranthus tricolor TaxID=29722 RepID=UPI002587125A|nr:uncharacterized protein LOC130808887 [Amaranthus tricolor]